MILVRACADEPDNILLPDRRFLDMVAYAAREPPYLFYSIPGGRE